MACGQCTSIPGPKGMPPRAGAVWAVGPNVEASGRGGPGKQQTLRRVRLAGKCRNGSAERRAPRTRSGHIRMRASTGGRSRPRRMGRGSGSAVVVAGSRQGECSLCSCVYHVYHVHVACRHREEIASRGLGGCGAKRPFCAVRQGTPAPREKKKPRTGAHWCLTPLDELLHAIIGGQRATTTTTSQADPWNSCQCRWLFA